MKQDFCSLVWNYEGLLWRQNLWSLLWDPKRLTNIASWRRYLWRRLLDPEGTTNIASWRSFMKRSLELHEKESVASPLRFWGYYQNEKEIMDAAYEQKYFITKQGPNLLCLWPKYDIRVKQMFIKIKFLMTVFFSFLFFFIWFCTRFCLLIFTLHLNLNAIGRDDFEKNYTFSGRFIDMFTYNSRPGIFGKIGNQMFCFDP